MIVKVEMYTVECDNCKTTRGQDSEYSCWNDESYALDEAMDHDWIEHDGKHLCPDCYKRDENDSIIITEQKNDNN